MNDLATLDASIESLAMEDQKGRFNVRFFTIAVHDQNKSIEAGRPVYKDVEMIHVTRPGDRTTAIERPVNARDKVAFRAQYQAFKAGQTALATSGTPIREWPGATRSQAEELAYFNIHSVEDLAEAADSSLSALPYGNTLKAKAIAYLERAAVNAPAEATAKKLEEQALQIASLQAQLNQVLARRTPVLEDEEEE